MRLMLLSLVGLGLSLPAAAQDTPTTEGFDAHGFQLAAFDGDPRDPLETQRPGRFTQGEWWAGGLFEYANDPLVEIFHPTGAPEDGSEDVRTVILTDIYAANLSAGVAVIDRLRLDMALPLYFSSTDLDNAPKGFSVGDIRLSAMAALVRPEQGSGFGLGLVPYIDLPTGDSARFLGQPGLSGGAKLAATYELTKLTLGGDVGAQFNPSINLDNLKNSDRLTIGVAAGYLVAENVGLNLEGRFLPPFQANTEAGTDFPAEALLSLAGRAEGGGHWNVGAGMALSQGASAARYRVFVGGGFGHMKWKAKDTDMDGIPDKVDACPTQPESMNGWKDTDGCPDNLGTLAVKVTFEGKPWKTADIELQGPDGRRENRTGGAEPVELYNLMPGGQWSGLASAAPCLEGEGTVPIGEGRTEMNIDMQRTAPAKLHFEVTDATGKPISGVLARLETDHPECIIRGRIPLGEDGKADQDVGAGNYTVTLTQNDFLPYTTTVTLPVGGEQTIKVVLETGKVQVSDQAIVILDKVYFETAKDVIKPESFGLLDQVAAIFKAHPEIQKVEISGHTDSQGKDAYNLDLSDRRAKSVRTYLLNKGVEGGRMDAKGYGETKPIAPNTTAAGRAQNRRVEFNITEKAAADQ